MFTQKKLDFKSKKKSELCKLREKKLTKNLEHNSKSSIIVIA